MNSATIKNMASSATDCWNTPRWLATRIETFMQVIDLDPCPDAARKAIPAMRHALDDGLLMRWAGRVYVNPPYGREIPKWIMKAFTEYNHQHIEEMILLVPARVDTRWFKPLFTQPICLITGRLHFNDGPQGAMFPSALVYFGGRPAHFADDFSDIGTIVRGWGAEYAALWHRDNPIHQERVACGA